MKQINNLLASSNEFIDDMTAMAMIDELNNLEHVDRLQLNAEIRRDVALRELERLRTRPARSLRVTQEIDDAEFRVIEAKPAIGRKRGRKGAT